MWGLGGLPVPRGQFRARAAVLPQLERDSDLTPGGDLGPVFMLLLSRPPPFRRADGGAWQVRADRAGWAGQGSFMKEGGLRGARTHEVQRTRDTKGLQTRIKME